jgi:hypothetical protein
VVLAGFGESISLLVTKIMKLVTMIMSLGEMVIDMCDMALYDPTYLAAGRLKNFGMTR